MSISKEQIKDFILGNDLNLVATQKSISAPIINRIYRKMICKVKFNGIKVVDGCIIDGHHRYIASQLADFNIEKIPWIRPDVKENIDWKLVVITDLDESDEEIAGHNQNDAERTDITLQQLEEMLSKLE